MPRGRGRGWRKRGGAKKAQPARPGEEDETAQSDDSPASLSSDSSLGAVAATSGASLAQKEITGGETFGEGEREKDSSKVKQPVPGSGKADETMDPERRRVIEAIIKRAEEMKIKDDKGAKKSKADAKAERGGGGGEKKERVDPYKRESTYGKYKEEMDAMTPLERLQFARDLTRQKYMDLERKRIEEAVRQARAESEKAQTTLRHPLPQDQQEPPPPWTSYEYNIKSWKYPARDTEAQTCIQELKLHSSHESCEKSCKCNCRRICKVCMTREVEVFTFPCTHIFMCRVCYQDLPAPVPENADRFVPESQRKKLCPVCREPIERIILARYATISTLKVHQKKQKAKEEKEKEKEGEGDKETQTENELMTEEEEEEEEKGKPTQKKPKKKKPQKKKSNHK